MMQGNSKGSAPIIVHDIQRRQILSLMGINAWVSRESPTQVFDDAKLNSLMLQPSLDEPIQNIIIEATTVQAQTQNETQSKTQSKTQVNSSYQPATTNHTYIEDRVSNESVNLQLVTDEPTASHPVVTESLDYQPPSDIQQNTIAAFHLVGAQYKAWVLMVDATVLDMPDLAKLWENIVQSLGLTTTSISFPFCDSMQDAAIANASLSGFIFSIAKREDTQVAMLTALPQGLGDERIIQAPYLIDMLKNGNLKKQLWELIR